MDVIFQGKDVFFLAKNFQIPQRLKGLNPKIMICPSGIKTRATSFNRANGSEQNSSVCGRKTKSKLSDGKGRHSYSQTRAEEITFECVSCFWKLQSKKILCGIALLCNQNF